MAAGCSRSFGSLKGWNKVESGFKAFQFTIDGARKPRNHRTALGRAAFGFVALFLSLALLSGCFRDPNVRKHKYLESGQKCSAHGKDREAAIQYYNALKIDKNFAEAHYALAQSYLHMGDGPRAYGELQRTVYLQPTNYKARIDLGSILLYPIGKPDDAQAQADAVIAAQPDNADAHALLS